ncbi:MAG: FtsX-like permease family protein [Anaerolineae bacterium]|nr:FtsX-like permease family protein [Anaerolineae bacterium]
MDVIWHKVWHDLWHHKARTLLVVLSIASGVFAIGAIFGMVDQLLGGMDSAHQAVNPAHINIFLNTPIDQDTAVSLTNIPGVAGVEPNNRISIRYKTDPNAAWQDGTITMRDDYAAQQYDLLALKAGHWPEGQQIGVERLTSQYYGLDMGDQIIIEMDGTDRTFTIDGRIRHSFVQPPPFGGEAHFFADAAGLAKLGIPEGQFASLLVQVEPYSRPFAEEVAGNVRERLSKQGYNVSVTIYQEPDRHWGRDFVDGLMIVLRVMAIVSLFLSVVLVINTFTAVITQQTDQIGVIKAIGGSSRLIAQTYLAGVLLVSLLALMVALPLGALAAFASSRWFLNLFNVDFETFQFSPQAVMWQVVAATAVPLLAALWPVLKGAGLTVREAIATYGLGGDFGSSRFDRFVDRISARYLSAVYAAALGNMFRRKGRLALTQLVLVIAGVMFLVVMTLVASTNHTLDNEMARRGYDARIGFVRDQRSELVLKAALAQPEVTTAEVWYTHSATILREGERLRDSAGLGAQLTGLPPDSQMRRPLIVAGRWLQPGDGRVIVINADSAAKNGIAVGDVIRLDLGMLGEAEWQVIGTYRLISGADFATEPIYAPLDEVVAVTKQANRGTTLYLQTSDPSLATTTAVTERLKNEFEGQHMDVALFATAIKPAERAEIDTQFASVVTILLSLAGLMALVGAIGLMGALGISVVERTREIGVLRAIGASSPTIMRLFIMEGVLQGLLSWCLAIPLALLFSRPLASALGRAMTGAELDFAFSGTAVLIWLVVILAVSALAAILPARSATRVSVRQSLAYA